jgi:Xaa-Pro aminopeptidase
LKYLVSDEKIRAIYGYRSQRILDLIKEHDLDFLYLSDYGNTRYAFDVMPRFHPESDACFGYLVSKNGLVSPMINDAFGDKHPHSPGGIYDPGKPGSVWSVDDWRSAGSESYLRSVPRRWAAMMAEAIATHGGAKRIGFDGASDLFAIQELQKLVPDAEIVGMGIHLAKKRMVKSTEEIELMEEACKVHNKIMLDVMGQAKVGWTDYDMASRMAYEFARLDCSEQHCLNLTYKYEPGAGVMGLTWSPIGRVYQEGDVITSDLGFMAFGGVTTDYGRCRIMGETSAKVRDAYEWNIYNYHETMTTIKPGQMISSMVETFIDAHDKKGYPLVMLGHGIGAQMDEMPQMNPANVQDYDVPLEEGMVLCLEPTLIVECEKHGFQQIWIEDEWVVEKDGLRRLAPAPYFDIEDKNLATMS